MQGDPLGVGGSVFLHTITTLPHDLIKNQIVDLIENTFRREEVLYLACNEERAFFALKNIKIYR